MTDARDESRAMRDDPPDTRLMTPAGLQANGELERRRGVVGILTVATGIALLSAAASVLAAGGWTAVGWVIFLCFAVASPWTILGFWNATLGLWLLHGGRGRLADVAPFLAAGDAPVPLRLKTAVVMTLRNEEPARAIVRFRIVKASIDATGDGAAFGYVILSDTDRAAVASAEEALVASWKESAPEGASIVYRRRPLNTGYKAGNVRDFCAAEGRAYDLMVPLDADSLMAGDAIVRLVRIMQAHPKLGIVQSLVVGSPSASAFARIFQFGMRLGMRTYTMGQAWWTADCGPFWGHNAIVRIAPFRDACALPVIAGGPPFGGHVLSHDQVEATLMRRAGYEVRVLPVEGGSFEDNPPTMLDFLTRDVRWCQGNLQYVRLLDLPGLLPMGRFQLVWAILMFAGQPAFTLMIALAPIAVAHYGAVPGFPVGLAKGLYATFLLMYLAPKIAGVIDCVLTPGEVARFGGAARFSAGVVIELVFSFLQGAVSAIHITVFMVGLLVFGRAIGWAAQTRDTAGVPWGVALAHLWPQLLFGGGVCGALWWVSPTALLWSLPLTAGYVLAIPLCVISADPRVGAWMKRIGLAGIPEDFDPPPELIALSEQTR